MDKQQPDETTPELRSENVDDKASFHIPKKVVYVLAVLAAVILVAIVVLVLGNRTTHAPDVPKGQSQAKSTPVKKSPPVKPAEKEPSSCSSGLTHYADKSFGASFCYPSAWGTATLSDAKVAPSDSGQRELIRFSEQPFVIVGGMSEDWSTTVGRGVGCLEPDNAVPPLSSYNTAWHNFEGSGVDVSYAIRSLPSSVGGYTIQETTSNMVISGVCVQGHKVISGSRYKVVAVNFGRDFVPASGITTPAEHMAEPNVLFSTELRSQYDAVLASLEAY